MTDFTVEVDVNNWNDGGVWRRSSFSGGLASGVLLVTGASLVAASLVGLGVHRTRRDPSSHEMEE